MRSIVPAHDGVYALVAYHLGWRDACGRPVEGTSGKLIRPVACLLAAGAFGEERGCALDAACAIELLHAFSLVHDDIEDGDRERRHRPTLWALHGVPLALNAGDSLFALAHRALAESVIDLPPIDAFRAMRLFHDAVLLMIEGQHEDLAFESRDDVSLAAYERMAARKTGALLGAALSIGAIYGGASFEDAQSLRAAGVETGLAFQAIDDMLAIWGNARATGKPAKNDLERGKKSLPVILAHAVQRPPDDAAVRQRCERFAADHSLAARRLLRSTAMSPRGLTELESLLDFVLERES
jgi:geranylgeranyl diphosphate synthase type I